MRILHWGRLSNRGSHWELFKVKTASMYVYAARQYKVTRHFRGRSLVCTFCQNSLLAKVWSVRRVQTVQSSQLSGSLICCCHTLRHPSTLFLLSHFLVHLPMLLLVHHLVHLLLVHFFFLGPMHKFIFEREAQFSRHLHLKKAWMQPNGGVTIVHIFFEEGVPEEDFVDTTQLLHNVNKYSLARIAAV